MKNTKDLLKSADETKLVVPMEDGNVLLIETIPAYENGEFVVKLWPSHWESSPIETEPYWPKENAT